MITQCQIINNTATDNGGGVYLYTIVEYTYNITFFYRGDPMSTYQ